MGFGGSLICSFMILTILSNNLPISVNGQPILSRCPILEPTVRTAFVYWSTVRRNLAPAILKLHYSDCFIEGCDGSVLLLGPGIERSGNLNLHGFEVIEDMKRRVDYLCPGVVSCSDILAIAARDAVVLRSGPGWDVKLGRRDSRVSFGENVLKLPSNNDNITVLLKKFTANGLNLDDFVALIGGSTITKPVCNYIKELVYKKTDSNNERPILVYMEKKFVDQLRASCYFYYLSETPHFHSLRLGDAVLKMDLSLLTDPNFYLMFQGFVSNYRFKNAMEKMSQIVKLGEGEIRTNCSLVNNN